MLVIHQTFLNNFARKLYFIQVSTTRQWLAVEDYFKISMMRLLEVFLQHQKSKFSQIQYNKYERTGASIPKSMIHIPSISVKFMNFLHISAKLINFPCVCKMYASTSFFLNLRFFFPYLTMMIDAFMHHA